MLLWIHNGLLVASPSGAELRKVAALTAGGANPFKATALLRPDRPGLPGRRRLAVRGRPPHPGGQGSGREDPGGAADGREARRARPRPVHHRPPGDRRPGRDPRRPHLRPDAARAGRLAGGAGADGLSELLLAGRKLRVGFRRKESGEHPRRTAVDQARARPGAGGRPGQARLRPPQRPRRAARRRDRHGGGRAAAADALLEAGGRGLRHRAPPADLREGGDAARRRAAGQRQAGGGAHQPAGRRPHLLRDRLGRRQALDQLPVRGRLPDRRPQPGAARAGASSSGIPE